VCQRPRRLASASGSGRGSCIDAGQLRDVGSLVQCRNSMSCCGMSPLFEACVCVVFSSPLPPGRDRLLRPDHVGWQAASMNGFAGASSGDIPIPSPSSELIAPISDQPAFWSSASAWQQSSPPAGGQAEDSLVTSEEQHHRPATKKASPSLSASSSSSSSNASKRKQFSSCDACVSGG
jgi:hypothetical protein